MCTHSPESPSLPGLHQQKRGQQVEGGDSAPLLRFHETPSGALCSALGLQHKKDLVLMEQVQRRATNMIREVEHL